MSDERAYRILITFDAKNERYEARVPELQVSAKGETRAEAVSNIETEIEVRIEEAVQAEETLAAPSDAEEAAPGEITMTIAGPLMQDLRYFAKRNDLSPDELASQLLARAIRGLHGRPQRRAEPERTEERQEKRGGNRRRRREGYQPEMDDQASFLAYVRDQEKRGGRR